MTVDAGELAAERARLDVLRCHLGAHLATCRRAAGVSQPELAQALGRTRERDGVDTGSGAALVHGELAEELMAMVTRLVRSVGRRQAMQMASWVLAAVGLSGLDADELTRVAQAARAPRRLDPRVVENLAATLAHCKRLEDRLGPCEVLDTVLAQHGIVRRLLEGGCPDKLVKPLRTVQSNISSTIGTYLINMDDPDLARGYFEHARRAGHEAGNPSSAAYALDGQHNACMTASGRAHELLAGANGSAPDSPAYWMHHGTVDSQRSLFLCLLGKPRQAVDAASSARDRFNRNFVGSYARCQVRLGHALVLDKELTEAARILGDAATQANHSPRVIAELHAARALMRPWQRSHAVTALDTQLEACGLRPTAAPPAQSHNDRTAGRA